MEIQAFLKWIKKISSLEQNRVSTKSKEMILNTRILLEIKIRKIRISSIVIKCLKINKTLMFWIMIKSKLKRIEIKRLKVYQGIRVIFQKINTTTYSNMYTEWTRKIRIIID